MLAIVAGLAGAGCSGGIPLGSNAQTGSIGVDAVASRVEANAARPGQAAADSTPRPAPAAFRAALVLPITGSGQIAPIAQAMRQAAEMAAADNRDSGLHLVVKDGKGTAEASRLAAEEATREGAQILLGPLQADAVAGAANAARNSGLPVLAFSSDRRVAGNGVWLISYLPGGEVRRLVEHTTASGLRRYVTFIADDAYGRLIEAGFRDAVGRSGGQILASVGYGPDSKGLLVGARDLAQKLAEIKAEGGTIDGLFMPVAAEHLPTIANLLPQLPIDRAQTRVLGGGGWEDIDMAASTALHGAWFVGADPTGWRAFSTRFGTAHGVMPPRLAALAFDAVSIAATLARTSDAGLRRQLLNRPEGFAGAEGAFRLLPDGTMERALAVLEVTPAGPRVVDPARLGDRVMSPPAAASGTASPPRALPVAALPPPAGPAGTPSPADGHGTPATSIGEVVRRSEGQTANPTTMTR